MKCIREIYFIYATSHKERRGYIMSGLLEEIIIEFRKESAIRMLKRGTYTYEEISEILELPINIIEQLSKKEEL